jgi:hypothetical protein
VTAPADSTAQPDIDVLARGPVHEAFARPSDTGPTLGPVVSKKPPGPIPEVPPDQRPEGDNVIWVPGYWAWDTDRSDFIWVSGVWRVPPPHRKWVPGAWQEVDGGWQWSSGFWAPSTADSLQYLPEPPASLENGASSPAPDDDSFYIPGNWVYRNDAYAWQPGFWTPCRRNWTWVPSCYYWTPSGYVNVDGYWDYPLEDRGLLFAPVCFNRPLWDTAGWSFCPSYCIEPALLTSALFCGPGRNCFYFGNYWGPGYRSFSPWFAPWAGNTLLAYYRWANAGNAAWFSGLRAAYAARFTGTLARPAATLRAQERLLAANRALVGTSAHLLRPLNGVHGHVPLTRLSPAQVRAATARAEQFHHFAATRRAPIGTAMPRAGSVPHNLTGPHISTLPSIRHTPSLDHRAPTIHSPARSFGPTIHPSAPSHAAPLHHVPQFHSTPSHHVPMPAHSAPRRSVGAFHSAPNFHPAAPTHSGPAIHPSAPAFHSAPVHHAPAPAHHAPARAPAHAAPAHRGGGGGGHHR